MRTLIAIAIAVAVLPTLAAAEDFTLEGTWTGHRQRMATVEGFREGEATLVVTEVRGHTFRAMLRYGTPEGGLEEPLVGAYTQDGALIAAADAEGVYSFHLADANTLDYCYVEAGAASRAVCARLTRQP